MSNAYGFEAYAHALRGLTFAQLLDERDERKDEYGDRKYIVDNEINRRMENRQ